MITVCITGANRGIGLGFVQYYLDQGAKVIAIARNLEAAFELQTLSKAPNLILMQADVTCTADVDRVREALVDQVIDVLINNAGTYGRRGQTLAKTTQAMMLDAFTTNACGTLSMIQALYPNVAQSQQKCLVAISSKMGSISDNTSGGYLCLSC